MHRGKGEWRGDRVVMTIGHGRVKMEWERGEREKSDAHRRMPKRNPLSELDTKEVIIILRSFCARSQIQYIRTLLHQQMGAWLMP